MVRERARRKDDGAPVPRRRWLGRLGWSLLCSLLIVWAFVLGVLVGQGSLATPDQMAAWQRWLAKLPGMQPPQVEPAAQESPPPADLSFYHGLQGKPAPTPQEKRPKVRKLRGRFNVQVASFKEEGQAKALVKRLRKAGLPAYPLKSRLQGVGIRYRVRVGPYGTRRQAKEAAVLIRSQHKLAAYVTMD